MPAMNLPVHWKTARLGDVTDIFKGGTPKRSVEKYFRGDIPWAIPTDITALDSALYIDDTDTHISEEALGKSAARLLPAGTVLLTSRATIGETAITTIPMATNQGFANFMCKEMLLNVYLAYYLRYVKKRLIDLAHGSTFKEITKGTLLNVEIPLPPLPEQRAIAHVLQTIQEANAARQRELTLERERKAALMDHLFSHGTKGEPRKQTEIGEIPESWELVELNKVCSKIVDCPHSTPKFLDSGVLCARNFNIRSGIYVREPASYTSEAEYLERIKRLIPQEGDVLFSREAPIGEACLIPPDTRLSLGQRMMLLRVNSLMLDAYFLVQSFYVTPLRTKMLSLGRGATAKHLNVRDVKQLEIPIPPLNEQQEISEILQACDTKIAALEQEAERLDELFHAMLHELMTGQRSAVPLIDAELPN